MICRGADLHFRGLNIVKSGKKMCLLLQNLFLSINADTSMRAQEGSLSTVHTTVVEKM